MCSQVDNIFQKNPRYVSHSPYASTACCHCDRCCASKGVVSSLYRTPQSITCVGELRSTPRRVNVTPHSHRKGVCPRSAREAVEITANCRSTKPNVNVFTIIQKTEIVRPKICRNPRNQTPFSLHTPAPHRNVKSYTFCEKVLEDPLCFAEEKSVGRWNSSSRTVAGKQKPLCPEHFVHDPRRAVSNGETIYNTERKNCQRLPIGVSAKTRSEDIRNTSRTTRLPATVSHLPGNRSSENGPMNVSRMSRPVSSGIKEPKMAAFSLRRAESSDKELKPNLSYGSPCSPGNDTKRTTEENKNSDSVRWFSTYSKRQPHSSYQGTFSEKTGSTGKSHRRSVHSQGLKHTVQSDSELKSPATLRTKPALTQNDKRSVLSLGTKRQAVCDHLKTFSSEKYGVDSNKASTREPSIGSWCSTVRSHKIRSSGGKTRGSDRTGQGSQDQAGPSDSWEEPEYEPSILSTRE